MDDIATAAGPQKLNNAANATWAVSTQYIYRYDIRHSHSLIE